MRKPTDRLPSGRLTAFALATACAPVPGPTPTSEPEQAAEPAAAEGPEPETAIRIVTPAKGETHLRGVRMLTNGGQNAEAYLSFDETSLIFQSTRGDLSCDQIFTMDLEGRNQTMVSTGKGRTTCAYFLPGDTRILYASTHAAAPECPPEPDRSRGYVWKLYDEFDIYSAARDGTDVQPLVTGKGYDAEATVSPRGDRFVFTSTRDGDPEIYAADLDGSNQTRLTTTKGYDGGPFFSADGTKIVYRANHPEGKTELAAYADIIKEGLVRPTRLELFVMDADGKNQRQITNNGKANFAPFFHPDGKRIVFSSNVNAERGRNFDLFIVGIDGQGLEQVTHNPTFDGFPMFTRDGKRLIFASNRANASEGETNIFIAEWVD